MSRNVPRSSSLTKLMATPLRPNRPPRPMLKNKTEKLSFSMFISCQIFKSKHTDGCNFHDCLANRNWWQDWLVERRYHVLVNQLWSIFDWNPNEILSWWYHALSDPCYRTKSKEKRINHELFLSIRHSQEKNVNTIRISAKIWWW